MSNVTRLRHALPLSQDINKVLTELDNAIAKDIDAAKAGGYQSRQPSSKSRESKMSCSR